MSCSLLSYKEPDVAGLALVFYSAMAQQATPLHRIAKGRRSFGFVESLTLCTIAVGADGHCAFLDSGVPIRE